MTALQTDDIRRSASLIIVNLRNEILLVHRNPKLTAFGGFHVRTLLVYCTGTITTGTLSVQPFDGNHVWLGVPRWKL